MERGEWSIGKVEGRRNGNGPDQLREEIYAPGRPCAVLRSLILGQYYKHCPVQTRRTAVKPYWFCTTFLRYCVYICLRCVCVLQRNSLFLEQFAILCYVFKHYSASFRVPAHMLSPFCPSVR